jgi:hypothetical protein
MEKRPHHDEPRTDVPTSADDAPRRTLFDAPPPEVPGDVFDRQRVMVSWQQKKACHLSPPPPSFSEPGLEAERG